MIFKYTFKSNDKEFPGYINLEQVAHVDFITRDFPTEGGTVTKEGCILTFPWQVQKQVPEPLYDTPSKVQKLSGELPPIKSWRNTIMWVNYTVIIENPEQVQQIKAYYDNLSKQVV